jgi:hypothetical protein
VLRQLRVPSDDGKRLPCREEHRHDAALQQLGPDGLLVKRERGVEFRELVRGHRRARRGGRHGLEHRGVREQAERGIRGGELLYGGNILDVGSYSCSRKPEPKVEVTCQDSGRCLG